MPYKAEETDQTEAKNAPLYDEKTRNIILRFLAACSFDCDAALAKYTEMAKNKDLFRTAINAKIYWQNARSMIKWLAHRATQRQRHLITFPDDHLTSRMQEWLSRPKA